MKTTQAPLIHTKPWQRRIAWALIAALANPATVVPLSLYAGAANARDTDIYLAARYAGDAATPAIMLVIDSSDSMNIPETWREYSGAYDSHVEYLGNSQDFIARIGCTDGTCSTGSGASFAATTGAEDNLAPPLPTATELNPIHAAQGYFSPIDDQAKRLELKQSVIFYTKQNESGDPGPRYFYRDYWGFDTSLGNTAIRPAKTEWMWWVPTTTSNPESDPRLRSNSFNRMALGSRITNFSSIVGSGGTILRGGGTYFGTTFDYSNGNLDKSTRRYQEGNYNKCSSSMSEIMPSTVFAPGPYPKNTGKWEGQQWMRWERWLGLESPVSVAPPTTGTGTAADPVIVTPPVNASSYPGENNNVSPGLTGGTYSRGYAGVTKASTDASTHFLGTQSRDNANLPIRAPIASSYSGWVDLLADQGGYNLLSTINNLSYSATAGNNSLNEILGYYAVGEITAIGVSTNTTTSWQFGARKGNRDSAAELFGTKTGVPAYYDSKVDGTPSPFYLNHQIVSGATSCTRSCTTTAVGTNPERDYRADNPTTSSTGAPARGTDLYAWGACTESAAPAAGCTASACGIGGTSNFTNTNNYGCNWSGRLSKNVEGLGTVYYGGSCQGSCKGETCAAIPATNYCNGPSSGTPGSNSTWVGDYTIDNTPYTNVTKSSTGATGNCSDKSDATQNCKTRAGVGVTSCTYSTRSLGSGGTGNTYACPNQTGTYGSTSVNFRYPVYNQRSTDSNLIHECIADNGKDPDSNVKTYNPYANATTQKNSFLVKAKRNFDQSPNQSVATSPTDGANPGSVGINFTASYASLSSSAITEDSNKKINIYSSNYLNWKFGAKACRNSSGALITSGSLTGAVCNPIGRKTRLQITKDALNDLIDTTDGVRFGLTVFNGLPSDLTLQSTKGSEGGKIMFPVLPMGADAADPNFKNRVELKRIINWLEADAATPLTETIHEVYRYFRGEQPYFGTSTALSTNCGASCLNSAAGGTGINGVTTGNAAESTSTSTFPTYTLKQLTINGANYVSPMAAQANAKCHKNHIVLVSDGGPDRDTSTDTLISTLVGGVELKDGGSPSLPYGSKDITAGSYIWLDELTNYMSLNDMYTAIAENQTISTYTIGFAGGNTPVLKNAATSSGGSNYLAEDSAALSAALAATIAAIRDWNPTIASPSVPLNALNRTESSDDAYLAFFGPKGGKAWDGTLKKYKISTKNTDCGNDLDGNQILMCLTGQASFSLGVKNINEFEKDKVTGKVSGKIREAAVGIWGDLGDPDGGKPNKGGSGYILSSTAGLTPDTRKVYTYLLPGSASNTLSNSTNAFSENNSLITKTRLGNAGMSDAKRASILNFTRGGDLANASCSDADSATACTTWRSWGHGDILHSKPAILSYEIIDDPDLTVDSNGDGIVDNDKTTRDYVFYMSNDGHLHAVDTTTGIEKWAFVPSEALGQLQAIMDNEVGEHITASDGSPVIYVEDTDKDGKITTADKAWLFFGLRRGGRAMYAFDIADKDNPKLMWKIDSTQAEFSELGETWSIPDVAKLRASADPVLVFGAGYDPKANDMITVSKLTNASGVASAETSVEHGYNSGESVTISGAPEAGYNLTTTITVTGTKTFTYPIAGSPVSPSQGKNFDIKVISNTLATMGRGVYFVNARTGALVKSFTGSAGAGSNTQVGGMIYSIPSEATALNADIDSAGYADRLYMGDLGGNVWRFDIDDANVSLWNAIRFADLSGATTPKRKVFFPPAVVKQEYLGQRFDAVYVGTGDVENPLRKDTTDYMFVVKDTETGISSAQSSVISFNTTDFYDVTDNLIQQGDSDQKTAAATAIKNAKGWFMRLEYSGKASVGVGEKVTSPPSVFFNVLRFNTFSPDASSGNSCLPDGTPSSYAISALDGSAPYDVDRNLTLTKSDRRDNAFESRGYTSPGVIVIRDGKVWLLNVSDGVSKATQIGTAGVAQRAYWFQEPER